jgi:diguanylate cyclase (GGDEF)-like protein
MPWRRHPDNDRLAEAVDEMRTRVDQLVGELAGALERAEKESRRNRLLSELGSVIDLDDLVDRVLDAALDIPGFDAATVVLDDPSGAQKVATRGLSPEEAAHPPTSGLGAGAPARTITVSFRYSATDRSPQASLIRGGLFVPLPARDGTLLGTLALFWRRPDFEPSREQVEAAEYLAESCVPAILNARRYSEARQLAETDALTGLYNQRYFHETLRREVLRAQRYGRNLALIVLDLDDFKAVNDRIGHLAGDGVLSQIAEGLREAVRSVDIACRIGGDEFAVILPESSVTDAAQLYNRVQERLLANATSPNGQQLRFSAGIAELEHGDTAAALFERADAALYRAKGMGKNRADIGRGYSQPPSATE